MKSKSVHLFYLTTYFVFQSTSYFIREIAVRRLFELSSKMYALFKTGYLWTVTKTELLLYPSDSLGYHLGCFLLQNSFQLQPRCESHDVFHVITGYGTDTTSEIALQYWLWGNGKRSPFTLLAMFAGFVLYADAYRRFSVALHLGRQSVPISNYCHQEALSLPLSNIKLLIKIPIS